MHYRVRPHISRCPLKQAKKLTLEPDSATTITWILSDDLFKLVFGRADEAQDTRVSPA